MSIVYLDNAATTKPFEEVYEVVLEVMCEQYYNPSSPYMAAVQIERQMDAARSIILSHLGARGRIIFTSGGSESNNLAIKGCTSKLKNPTIITSAIEHPSVLNTCKEVANEYSYPLVVLPVDSMGYVDADMLASSVADSESAFVSIMHVNNETGTIQDIEQLCAIAKKCNPKTVFHVDGVQGFLKIPLNIDSTQIDAYTISAHKIHGPKGVGALYIRSDSILSPVTYGGGQEDSYRSGTHNTQGICGMGKAVEVYAKNIKNIHQRMMDEKNHIIETLDSNNIDYILCGDDIQKSAPHILNIAFRRIKGEVLLSALESAGIMANTASACSSRKQKISAVLVAMNIDRAYIQGAIRLSLGAMTTIEDAQICAEALVASVQRLIKFS